MRSTSLLALSLLLVSRPLDAQTTDYVPSQRLTEGREIVAIYFGSTDCGPCQLPEVKAAIRAMKPALAAQARQRRMAFSVIGVAQDWDLKRGAAFLEPLGAFDQVVIGGNWTNVAVEQFVLRDSLAEMVIPQVVVIERAVQLRERVSVTEPRVLRRVTGSRDIPAWVAAGAPVEILDKKPR